MFRRRPKHDCPTPSTGARIGEMWKCRDCGAWWSVEPVDESDHGAWLLVERWHHIRRAAISQVLSVKPDLTFIQHADIREAQVTQGWP